MLLEQTDPWVDGIVMHFLVSNAEIARTPDRDEAHRLIGLIQDGELSVVQRLVALTDLADMVSKTIEVDMIERPLSPPDA